MCLEIFEITELKGEHMCCLEHYRRRYTGAPGFLPPGCAETPLVAGGEPRESGIRSWTREVVPTCFGEFEKRFAHPGTYDMYTEVCLPGIAAAVAIKAGERIMRAVHEVFAEYVLGHALKNSHRKHEASSTSYW